LGARNLNRERPWNDEEPFACCGCPNGLRREVAAAGRGGAAARPMDCAAIEAEILANNKTVQGLASDEGGKVAQNVAAGVVGLFIWPVWFAMDFQGTAGKEEAALESRQQYLAVLAEQKNCAAPPPQGAGSPLTVAAAPRSITPVSSPSSPAPTAATPHP
jgi:hypothetical protein